MGTIQLDYQMPVQFGLTYMGADNREHSPVVIHRALLGSLERFMGILVEHYGGDVPVLARAGAGARDPGRRGAPRRGAARSATVSTPRASASRSTSATRRSASASATPSSRRSRSSSCTATASRTTRSPCASGRRRPVDALARRAARDGSASSRPRQTRRSRVEVAPRTRVQVLASPACKQELIASSPPGLDSRRFNRAGWTR